ncbi:MAG: hypothetical protein CK533_05415 [Acidobacterium sp.]|nr:MAG: hypothetical protein CK533_05415 [Acidobacterium sp.]
MGRAYLLRASAGKPYKLNARLQSCLDEAAGKARQMFGSAKVLDHPILGALSVNQWLKFHLVHTTHHAALFDYSALAFPLG